MELETCRAARPLSTQLTAGVFDPSKCVILYDCVSVCPQRALTLFDLASQLILGHMIPKLHPGWAVLFSPHYPEKRFIQS